MQRMPEIVNNVNICIVKEGHISFIVKYYIERFAAGFCRRLCRPSCPLCQLVLNSI